MTRVLSTSLMLATVVLSAPVAAQTVPNTAAAASGVSVTLPAAAEQEFGRAAALGLELRRLGTTKRVLMIAAHPDDEDTSLLTHLARGRGAEVAYLSLTRGEGGQNGIGQELQEALGLLRSGELRSARQLDGARQYFTRAYDFGYSRTLDETLAHWPREAVLADVVAAVRWFRPDIVLSVFGGTPADGHGHHQAAGVLAREAFEAAGDPGRFPDQLGAGLAAHGPTKLYRSSWFRPEHATLRLQVGNLDPLLGRSHFQVAMASRSRHRSQDMGRLQAPGPRWAYVQWLAARPGLPAADEEASLFEGVDTTVTARARAYRGASAAAVWDDVVTVLATYESRAAALRESYNPLDPGRLVPELAAAAADLQRADSLLSALEQEGADRLRFHVAAEREAAGRALALAGGVVLDAVSESETVVAGEPFELELVLWNGGASPLQVKELAPSLPAGWRAEALGEEPAELAPGDMHRRRFRVRPPADAVITEPYYLRAPRAGSLYRWPDTVRVGVPFDPPPVAAAARVEIAGTPIELVREAEHRDVDPRLGEVRRPLRVVPAVTVAVAQERTVAPLGGDPPGVAGGSARVGDRFDGGQPERGPGGEPDRDQREGRDRAPRIEVTVRAESASGAEGELILEPPPGWAVEPERVPLALGSGETRRVEVRVSPPDGAAQGRHRLAARFETSGGARFERGYALVDYPHVAPRPIYRDAEVEIVTFGIAVPPLRVGYVLGAADRVAEALAPLGLELELLDESALAAADLSHYDAIVVGPRAYEIRPDLAASNDRLLEFARAGGTLVVQYQQYAFVEGGYAPYPLEIARPHDRVTDPASPVRILDAEHPTLLWPNPLIGTDFEGWVQERGLYFARDWDPRYTPLLELRDPDRDPVRGGLLVAPLGDGVYVYTGLAFFRQLPAGVPGAYRLFLNLLSLRRDALRAVPGT